MNKILVLGASRYYVDSIKVAKKFGYKVYVVDRVESSPGFMFADQSEICDIRDIDKVETLCRKWKINAVVPVNDYGVPTAAEVSLRLGLRGLSINAAQASTSKALMRKKWNSEGLPSPKFEVHSDIASIHEAIIRIGFPSILKPAHGVGGGSRGVVVVRTESEIKDCIRVSQSYYDDKATIIEEFVDGISEHSCEVILDNGDPKLIVVGDKEKSRLPFRVDRSVIYPTNLMLDQIEIVEEVVCRAVVSLGINVGAAHVEFAMTESGPVLFELGARCGGGATPSLITPYVTGVELFIQQIRSLLGETLEIKRRTEFRGCVYRFLFFEPGKVQSVNNWDSVTNDLQVLDCELFVKPNDQVVEVRSGLDRSGYMVVAGVNRADALQKTFDLESLISVVTA